MDGCKVLCHIYFWQKKTLKFVVFRTICQIILATALELQSFGHNSVPLLRLVMKLGLEHDIQEEAAVAMSELSALVDDDHLQPQKLLEYGNKLREIKNMTFYGGFIGLALSLRLQKEGLLKKSSEILNNLADCEALNHKNIVNICLRGRSKFELSKQKLNSAHIESEDKHLLEGPLELAHTGWQLMNLIWR